MEKEKPIVDRLLKAQYEINDLRLKIAGAIARAEKKSELVSNCCSYPMPDTDIIICPNCGEHCQIVDLNKEEQ